MKRLELAQEKTVCGPATLPDQSPSVNTASLRYVRPREQPQELLVSYLEWNPGFHAWQQVSLSGLNTLGHLAEDKLGSPFPQEPPPPNPGNCLCTVWVARTSWILEVFLWSQARAPGSISLFLKWQTRGPETQRALLGVPSIEWWSFIAAQPRAFMCVGLPPSPQHICTLRYL